MFRKFRSRPSILLLAALSLTAVPAAAEKYRVVKLTPIGKEELRESCKNAGGEFGDYIHDWTCQTRDGVVACNETSCTGVNPAAISRGRVPDRPGLSDLQPAGSLRGED